MRGLPASTPGARVGTVETVSQPRQRRELSAFKIDRIIGEPAECISAVVDR
jgi:hypothetical protein